MQRTARLDGLATSPNGSACSAAGPGTFRARSASRSGSAVELRSQHPLLLLELPNHVDQDVLRDEVDFAKPVHPRPSQLADLRYPVSQLAYDRMVLDRRSRDRADFRPRGDSMRLPIRDVAQCDRPLGDHVRELTPRIDQLIELQVERPEQLADHRPMQLLADQRQTDQVMQRCLELATKGCAL